MIPRIALAGHDVIETEAQNVRTTSSPESSGKSGDAQRRDEYRAGFPGHRGGRAKGPEGGVLSALRDDRLRPSMRAFGDEPFRGLRVWLMPTSLRNALRLSGTINNLRIRTPPKPKRRRLPHHLVRHRRQAPDNAFPGPSGEDLAQGKNSPTRQRNTVSRTN